MRRSLTLALLAVMTLALGFAAGRLTAPGARPAETWVDRPSRGPADAPVVLVEYTDYQCPFCRRYHEQTYAAVLAEYGDRIRYEVRQFPLPNIHPYARGAARAAVCAQRQGHFWEFHDALFASGPGGLTKEALIGHAVRLGLSVDVFRKCLESETSGDVVSGDFMEGVREGVRSTPTFLVNGRRINGSQPIDTFRFVLDSALAAAGAS